MTVRVEVAATLYRWASDRSGIDVEELHRRFPKLTEWEAGLCTPTLKQLERFARATKTPVGCFFGSEPPEDEVPIPDMRTMGDGDIVRPSTDLLDTIYQCQRRQDWYSDHVRGIGTDPVPHVGSLSIAVPAAAAVAEITTAVPFPVEQRGANHSEAFTLLRSRIEDCGVLVMVNAVVGNNTHRKLDPREFRGFALADAFAPVVFVNGADAKAAQIFTLAHELAHIWLGESALSDADPGVQTANDIERWCNLIAAEILVPLDKLRSDFVPEADITAELDRLARRFKSSTLVVLRRVHEAGLVEYDEYRETYRKVLSRVLTVPTRKGTGGDFYNTQLARVGKPFARSVIASTLEGRTLYRDALRMLGIKKINTFNQLSQRLGIT